MNKNNSIYFENINDNNNKSNKFENSTTFSQKPKKEKNKSCNTKQKLFHLAIPKKIPSNKKDTIKNKLYKNTVISNNSLELNKPRVSPSIKKKVLSICNSKSPDKKVFIN